jgi:hypothetical protein
MPRSSGQSDFVVQAQPAELPVELSVGAKAVDLPRAIWRTPFASARATRVIMAVTLLMLFALAVLCAVGPHIPSGE